MQKRKILEVGFFIIYTLGMLLAGIFIALGLAEALTIVTIPLF